MEEVDSNTKFSPAHIWHVSISNLKSQMALCTCKDIVLCIWWIVPNICSTWSTEVRFSLCTCINKKVPVCIANVMDYNMETYTTIYAVKPSCRSTTDLPSASVFLLRTWKCSCKRQSDDRRPLSFDLTFVLVHAFLCACMCVCEHMYGWFVSCFEAGEAVWQYVKLEDTSRPSVMSYLTMCHFTWLFLWHNSPVAIVPRSFKGHLVECPPTCDEVSHVMQTRSRLKNILSSYIKWIPSSPQRHIKMELKYLCFFFFFFFYWSSC